MFQVLEIAGITGFFFVLLIVSIFLSESIPFMDSIMSGILMVVSFVLGLTDLWSSTLGYIFYGEALVFMVSIIILMYRKLYG